MLEDLFHRCGGYDEAFVHSLIVQHLMLLRWNRSLGHVIGQYPGSDCSQHFTNFILPVPAIDFSVGLVSESMIIRNVITSINVLEYP